MRNQIVALALTSAFTCAPAIALAQGAQSAAEAPNARAGAGASESAPAPETGAQAPDAAADWQGNAASFYEAVKSGRWLDAVALGMLIVVFVLRRFGARFSPWFKTTQGGWVLNMATATAVSIAASMLSVGMLTIGTLLDALLIGLSAAGGYQAVKDYDRARKKMAAS